jgi:serine/threonine-protein kinase
MAPEQLRMDGIDRAIDVYATGVLLWELLVNRRIFDGRSELAFVNAVVNAELPSIVEALTDARAALGEERWEQVAALEPIVSRAMALAPADRFRTAADMLRALLEVRAAATSMAVSEWVQTSGAEFLDQRQRTLAANEESWRRTSVYATGPSSVIQLASRATTEAGQLAVDTPSGIAIVARPADRSPPRSPTLSASSAPPISLVDEDVDVDADADTDAGDAEAYRRALGASTLAAFARRLRSSRGLTIATIAAVSTLGAAGVFAALLGGPSEAGGAGTGAPALPNAQGLVANGDPTAAGASAAGNNAAGVPSDPTSDAKAVPEALAPPAPTRLTRVAPPPAPPRVFYASRPAAPPPRAPTAGPAQTSAPADCNPPFYFEGPKKVFKPSCL